MCRNLIIHSRFVFVRGIAFRVNARDARFAVSRILSETVAAAFTFREKPSHCRAIAEAIRVHGCCIREGRRVLVHNL